MNTRYVPRTEDFDNMSFAASQRLDDILRGELDIDVDELVAEWSDDHA